MLRRSALVLVLMAGCAHAPEPSEPRVSDFTCLGDGAQVEVDARWETATVWENGVPTAQAHCAVTHMAIFNLACYRDGDPDFRFFFASIPGPPILEGKSA